MRSTGRSTFMYRAFAPRSRTIQKSCGASSRSAAWAMFSPRTRNEGAGIFVATAPGVQTWMRRLYLQVYFTIVASLVLVVITAGLLWHFSTSFPPFGQEFEVAGEIIAELVPPADAPPQAQQEAIERLAERIGTDLALFSRTNERLAGAGGGRRGPWRHRA